MTGRFMLLLGMASLSRLRERAPRRAPPRDVAGESSRRRRSRDFDRRRRGDRDRLRLLAILTLL